MISTLAVKPLSARAPSSTAQHSAPRPPAGPAPPLPRDWVYCSVLERLFRPEKTVSVHFDSRMQMQKARTLVIGGDGAESSQTNGGCGSVTCHVLHSQVHGLPLTSCTALLSQAESYFYVADCAAGFTKAIQLIEVGFHCRRETT